MYKVIENGMEKMCSAKETEAMIRDFNITSENSPASAGGGMNRPDWKIG